MPLLPMVIGITRFNKQKNIAINMTSLLANLGLAYFDRQSDDFMINKRSIVSMHKIAEES
jgi:hypothetical protein